MKKLISLLKHALNEKEQLPFSVYSSVKEQCISNVSITKPLLIFILDGVKKLGEKPEIICPAGSFIFLSNKPTIDIRNIPRGREYFALVIEFELQDFDFFKSRPIKARQYCQGEINYSLEQTLQQFVEWSLFAPSDMWSVRRKEILQFMYYLGYEDISSMAEDSSISHRLCNIIRANLSEELNIDTLCQQLAMSESTLRRKLKSEGTSVQEIKSQTKLGYGLHLLQTTTDTIGIIANQCGYQSQSRFSDKFKLRFGLTPTAIRKTRMHD